jgi:hypothetical protein
MSIRYMLFGIPGKLPEVIDAAKKGKVSHVRIKIRQVRELTYDKWSTAYRCSVDAYSSGPKGEIWLPANIAEHASMGRNSDITIKRDGLLSAMKAADKLREAGVNFVIEDD